MDLVGGQHPLDASLILLLALYRTKIYVASRDAKVSEFADRITRTISQDICNENCEDVA
jgi:hypothetical protein